MTPPRGVKTKASRALNVEVIRHDDKRANIPTNELRGFVDEDEKRPKPALYPRDPSLDPQLVWRGKDEQDSHDLAVPTVPIYIQEKVHPQVIIENLRQTAAAGEDEPELTLFNDFNGITFEDLVDFYQHEQSWTNRMILGDSSLVMASLAEKEGLRGKVQAIYFDPPYGIGFRSNWQVTTSDRDVGDKQEDISLQPEQIRAFRDTWRDGIHSYLAYIRDRLAGCQDLLSPSGSLFFQISQANVHRVRCLLDEVFGSDNAVATIVYKKASPDTSTIKNAFNYLLWYAKDASQVKVRKLFRERRPSDGSTEDPRKLALWVELPDGSCRTMTTAEKQAPSLLPQGSRIFRVDKLVNRGSGDRRFEVEYEGERVPPPPGFVWRGSPDRTPVVGPPRVRGRWM